MPFPVTYFLHDEVIGQSEVQAIYSPDSLAFFCATCGTIWGRVLVEGAVRWRVETAPCERHERTGVPDWSRVPGSFLPIIPKNKAYTAIMDWGVALEHLPLPVLQREFELSLSYYERNQNETDE